VVTHYNLGVAYDELSRYDEAVEAYKRAIHINPDLWEAHNNLGFDYVELGHYDEAIEAYKQAIRLKPDDEDAHYGLGVFTFRCPVLCSQASQEYRLHWFSRWKNLERY